MSVDRARTAFGPEALSRFNQIIEEVSLNLVDDGLAAELVKSDEMRRKLAIRLLGFARLWWTDTQIKQLLLRTLRNQISASQNQTRRGGRPEQKISDRIEMAGGRCVALILVSMSLKLFGENQFGLPEVSAARIVERAEDGNQPPARQLG
jgi:hypothetical protein